VTPLRVLLADDHHVVRRGLRALLEKRGFEVVAEAADGQTAVELTSELQPDVAVLDVAMPVLNGVDAAGKIARLAPASRVLLLTALTDTEFVSGALRAGVRGFVAKCQDIDALLHAIEQVAAGGVYFSPGTSQAVLDMAKAGEPDDAAPLSERERHVVRLVAEGRSTKEIAALLEISVKTAEFHRGRAMRKLNIHDTAGLVRYAVRAGLVLP
jgi:DNA-binding NarL/FixJ family response regulator